MLTSASVSSKKSQPKLRASARVQSLDERLELLRTQLQRVSGASSESEIAALEDEKKLAQSVFDALRGDARRVRRFVNELAHLDAENRKRSP